MVLVGDVHVVTGPDVVFDLDRQVPDDPAPPAEETAIADAHDRIGEARLTRHHPRRQRHVRPDHRVGADVDVALVEDRRWRETDDAALPERPEAATTAGVRTDRPEPPGVLQPTMYQVAEVGADWHVQRFNTMVMATAFITAWAMITGPSRRRR